MSIEINLNRAMIGAKRNNIEFNTIFAGEKERKELRSLEYLGDFTDEGHVIKILYVDEESFLKVGYIHDN